MRARAYRILCGGLGGALLVAGLVLWFGFFRFHAWSFSQPFEPHPPLGGAQLDAYAAYFMAFAGCGLVAWGGSLLVTLRERAAARAIGTISAFALVLMALYRMFGWFVGDYPYFPLRTEVTLFLLLALAFVWLRPPARGAAGAV